VELSDMHITQGEDMLALYQFNTGVAKHYFCSRCGVYTHHQRRANPMQFGVNVACLEGLSPFDFDEVAVLDGNNHPIDTEKDAKGDTFGTLKFIKADD
ncbi:MAG: GFA family protein, partial [Kordiimonadaceae bacterium]|nr:GFA family protein [Kordiimonadaceae bacterium]